MIDLCVSVVSYNTRDLLRSCLRHLHEAQARGEAQMQIIVVDNGSRDGSPQMVRDEFPGVELLETGANLGYGPANNLAFQRCDARYFCALNSDADVCLDALQTLVAFMDTHPKAGACVPDLVWPDGAKQVAHGRDPKLSSLFWEQTFLGAVRAKLQPRATPDDFNAPQQTEQLNGACLFCRSEAYREVGGFDPSFWMYVEDVDLSVRLGRAGWILYFVPTSRVVHHLGASSRDPLARAKMISSYNRSRVVYFGRSHGKLGARYVKALCVFGAGLRLLAWTTVALVKPNARDKVRLFRETLRRTAAIKL